MSISFNSIPSGIRVPLFYAEFSNSNASQGPTLKLFKMLVVGQKLSTGTATANVPVRVSSAAQARTLFGAGSMLHLMFLKVFLNNTFTEMWAIPLADDGSGVAASATMTMSGTATAAGTIFLYIAGYLIQVGVASGDLASAQATAVVAAITAAVAYLPVTASASGAVVTITANNAGTLGNDIDLRVNYYPDQQALPAGTSVVFSVARLASGATDPSVTSAISAMGDTQYDIIAWPYTASTPLTAIQNELDSRWGPLRQIDGLAVTFYSNTVGNSTTFGVAKNNPHIVCPALYKSPSPSYEWCASVAAIMAYYGQIDPARPFQTLPVVGLLAPALADRFIYSDRQSLLSSGIATIAIDSTGSPRLERMVTMYQKNAAGDPDVSYLDANTVMTLSYLRYDLKAYFTSKYPRSKLANDGTVFGPGQAIITPLIAKAECVNKFRQWAELGLVEDADQFKRDLIVERDVSDVNRLNFLLPPNLVNQFVVAAMKIQYLL